MDVKGWVPVQLRNKIWDYVSKKKSVPTQLLLQGNFSLLTETRNSICYMLTSCHSIWWHLCYSICLKNTNYTKLFQRFGSVTQWYLPTTFKVRSHLLTAKVNQSIHSLRIFQNRAREVAQKLSHWLLFQKPKVQFPEPYDSSQISVSPVSGHLTSSYRQTCRKITNADKIKLNYFLKSNLPKNIKFIHVEK